MKFYYKLLEVPEPLGLYYTMSDLNDLELYPATKEIDDDYWSNEHSEYWPVHDPVGWTWEPVECKDECEAKEMMMYSLNNTIFETIRDI